LELISPSQWKKTFPSSQLGKKKCEKRIYQETAKKREKEIDSNVVLRPF